MTSKILIFGSSGDVGIEICKLFLKKNFYVYFTCSNKKSYTNTKKKLVTFSKSLISQKFSGLICDVSKENSLEKVIRKVLKKNSIDVVVNSIGVFSYDSILKYKKEELMEFIKLNTLPTILINKFILKYNKQNKKKINILTIGSSSAYDGFEKTISYSASKHALLSAIKSINKETYNHNIFNTLVNPSSIKSKMGKKIKNQKYSTFINASAIAEFVYSLSKINPPGIVEDVFYKRIIK